MYSRRRVGCGVGGVSEEWLSVIVVLSVVRSLLLLVRREDEKVVNGFVSRRPPSTERKAEVGHELTVRTPSQILSRASIILIVSYVMEICYPVPKLKKLLRYFEGVFRSNPYSACSALLLARAVREK